MTALMLLLACAPKWKLAQAEMERERSSALLETDAPLAFDVRECEDELAQVRMELNRSQYARTPIDSGGEDAARELYRQVTERIEALDFDGASELLQQIGRDYPNTATARRTTRTQAELEVIGRPAPAIDVADWFDQPGSYADADFTVLVFWEVWCPHCKRELPRLESETGAGQDPELQIIAFTKLSKSSTRDKAQAFVDEHDIRFPLAVESNGSMSEAFNVSGIPAAAIVYDGTIIWRGHPARLTLDHVAAIKADAQD